VSFILGRTFKIN